MVRGGLWPVVVCLSMSPTLALAQHALAVAPDAPPTPPAATASDAPPAAAPAFDRVKLATQPDLRVDLGIAYARRQLEFASRDGLASPPPDASSGGTSLRLDGEIYPFALAAVPSAVRDLGIALSYDKTIGTKIKGSNQTNDMASSVDQSNLALGARYRVPLGSDAMIAFGLDYVHRQYTVAMNPQAAPLDLPDVAYSAIAPTFEVRATIAPATTLVVAANAWLAFDAGPIADAAHYGAATVYGLTTLGGIEFALAKQLNLNLLFEYNRIELAFDGVGPQSNSRDNDPGSKDVNSATDHSMGIVATLGLTY